MSSPPLTPLCELARLHATDKGGWHSRLWTCHNYTATYHLYLKNKIDSILNVLEIGIGDGASLRMWQDYFPNAHIFGIDCNLSRMINKGRIHSFHADQGSAESLDAALNTLGALCFDLIVDDGSHRAEHQIFSANHLKSRLAENGLYVIEDIHFDCRPETILDHITWGKWTAVPVGKGLGGAHCECGCGGGETLLIGRH